MSQSQQSSCVELPRPAAILPEQVEVNGAKIRFGVSGRGERDLLLVHGHNAHQMWWHAVAPILEKDWRVIRFDLSGHGDSDHREDYSRLTWPDELHAVLAAVGSSRTVLVGHSMGGRVAIAAAAARPEGIVGVITMDTALRSVASPPKFDWQPERTPRVRATRDLALGRFRLAPDQPAPAAKILDVVAESSIRRIEGGWTWKYDQRGLPATERQLVEGQMATLTVPLRFVYAEHSAIVGTDAIDFLRTSPPPSGLEIIEMAGVHHHLILEEPEKCARLIDELASRF